MTPTENPQEALWNGRAGSVWAEEQDLLNGMFQPLADLLIDTLPADRPLRLLDIGCGTGATTRAAARRLGPSAHCTGVDISEPMITAARARAAAEAVPATFLRADAAVHPFPAGGFDRIISRFGVMFFPDPVAAFAHLRQAAASGAALTCVVWRGPEENPFMTAAERAAAPWLPDLPVRRPDTPGQFGFADARRVEGILAAGGWQEIEITPVDRVCTLPERRLADYFTRLGPLGQILPGTDPALRARLLPAVRAAFEPFADGETVRFSAACWLIRAQTGGQPYGLGK